MIANVRIRKEAYPRQYLQLVHLRLEVVHFAFEVVHFAQRSTSIP
jgi:hypothetical protein